MIRPMHPEDQEAVRGLYALCHAGAMSRPTGWYVAHPTLVLVEDGVVIGYTSFTVTLIPGFGQTMYGMDVAVHPGHRKRGYAAQLHRARLTIAKALGIRLFMGSTAPENVGMARVLTDAGAHACIPVGPEVLYVGAIGD